MTTHKLNIFEVLNTIHKKNQKGFDLLTEDQKKGFQPLVIMRWLSGTNDARQIFFLNELVNPFIFDFATNKLLLYYLMTACTSGRPQRSKWIKINSKRKKKHPLILEVISRTFDYNKSKSEDALILLSNDQIINFAQNIGYQKLEMTQLNKELKTR